VTEDEMQAEIAARLKAAGVEGVQAINPPHVRLHDRAWSLLLADSDDSRRAVHVLEHIPGVHDVRGGRRTSSFITFEVERVPT
jgi:hypothetical protein